MGIDAKLFSLINGLAGRAHWLDLLGQWGAVYGVLAVMLLALAALWWPSLSSASRRMYVWSLLAGVALCALLFLGEYLLTTQVLHHELRARPYNARWTTLLIADGTHNSFPAWPVLLAAALTVPTGFLAPRLGWLLALLSVMIGLAVVFVGSNFPLDAITGFLVGGAIGYSTSAPFFRRTEMPRLRPRIFALWLALAVWGGLLLLLLKPTHAVATGEGGDTKSATAISAVQVPAPPVVTQALQQAAGDARVTLQAASNHHLLVADIVVLTSRLELPLTRIQEIARAQVNTAFARWARLDLVTVEISGVAPGNAKDITPFYKATVAREQLPAGGFPPGRALPGKKYFNPRFY